MACEADCKIRKRLKGKRRGEAVPTAKNPDPPIDKYPKPSDYDKALDTKIDDIGRARFGYSQPVQGEQAGEGVVAGRSGLGCGQEPDCLLAVKPKRLGIARHRGATNMGGGGVGERAPAWTAER